jgi:ribulose-phosphate 3-epimerase
MLADILPDVGQVLVMSVNPGFGGQAFIPGSVDRIGELRGLAEQAGADVLIAVDGGIDTETAPMVTEAGARLLIAGNAVFGSDDPGQAVRAIREAGARPLA